MNKTTKLLEVNKIPNKLIFNKEVVDLEFAPQIANIDIYHNTRKRYAMLVKLGKYLNKKIKEYIPTPAGKEVLSREEIDALLLGIDPDYFNFFPKKM